MNRQEIFNTVRDHLLTQNKKAMSESDCVFLSQDGLKCAIGCLIPEGHLGQNNKGCAVTLIEEHPDLALLWGVEGREDESFLLGLQGIHDETDPKTWPEELTNFAKVRGLTS